MATPLRFGSKGAARAAPLFMPPFLWVDLTRDPSLLFHELCDLYPGHRISGHEHLCPAIEELSPSFLCFDYDYPGGDGMRLLADTGAHYPDVPLVMLTNDHAQETMVRAYRSGASSYVVKPIALHQLVREIRVLLALTRDHGPSPDGPLARRLPSQPEGVGPLNVALRAALGLARRLSSQPEGAGARGPERTAPRTAAALICVEQGFAEDLRLDDLAMACHMSGSHFSRTFKKEHGTSFMLYLCRYRLERACEFLASAETSVKQAAVAAGFNDCSYFGRVFRRRYGMTPRDYQATHSAPRLEEALGGARS